MKPKIKIVPILLFALVFLVLDRFMFLPGRMEGSWEYEYGTNIGEEISFQNIDIVNNFEVKIQQDRKLEAFYLVGCYFGNLYLLHKQTSEFTKYKRYEPRVHGIDY